jgi:hypothetical protein
LIAWFPLAAAAAVPTDAYPDCGEENLAACPSDFGDWDMISWIPAGSVASVRPAELALGSGISADIAFQHTTGRWDAVVAVLDSGIFWQESSLWPKIHLNAGELPIPIDGTGAENPDPDGNGLLTIDDYAADPRVAPDAGVDVADFGLDPSDLIAVFSDGVDGDGNGYTDDIAGWDFFGGDNNPFSDPQITNSDHGTGVMEEAGEAADDGGDVGVCPNCAILPVRVGDTFITHGDRIGLALAFAADHRVSAAAMAVGAMSHPGWTAQAVAWAQAEGVALVGAAGDENSFHRNFPAAEGGILYVHSIRTDSSDEDEDAYSYFNTWGCNNFGPRLDLVAPSGACATGAVAKTAGAAGLVASAGMEAGAPLSANEIRQVLIATADDVDVPEAERAVSAAWPSKTGWDAFFGYGRLDVGRAVEAVLAGDVPPEARLESPAWFSWAGDGKGVEIRGEVDAPRSSVAGWTLEIGAGLEPASWTEVASGAGPTDGALATVDLPRATGSFEVPVGEGVVDRAIRAHDRLVHIRLRVTDTAGRVGESRTAVWVEVDRDALPGFPLALGASVESAPVLADLDGDGAWEVVLATADGAVHAVTGSGAPLTGFPVSTDLLPVAQSRAWTTGAIDLPHEGILSGVAVGDVDGDARPDVVTASLEGRVYAWSAEGQLISGFPVALVGRLPDEMTAGRTWDNGFAAAPALADIDGDGALEIAIGGMDQRLYVWNGQGALLPGYPLELCEPGVCGTTGTRIIAPAAIGDIDGDGDLDAAVGTNEIPVGAAGLLYLVDLTTAAIWPGTPIRRLGLLNQTVLPLIGEGHPAGVALADLDGDGALELSSNAMLGSKAPIHADGSEALPMDFTAAMFGAGTNFSEGSMVPAVDDPVFADLDLDGTPDFLSGGVGVQWLVSLALYKQWDYEHGTGAWNGRTGESFPGFPRQIEDLSFLSAPSVGDLSGDGAPDVAIGSGGGFVHAWSANGTPLPGWPKLTGGWMLGGPALGDIDGDHLRDVVAATRDGLLFAWRTPASAASPADWPMNRHDPQNTGNWHTLLATQAGPASVPGDEGGCGCQGGAGGGIAALGAALALLGRRKSGRGGRTCVE